MNEMNISDDILSCSVCGEPTTTTYVMNKLFNSEKKPFCDICYEKEITINQQIADMHAARTPIQARITQLTNELIRELPTNDREYHVKEITSIVAIENSLRETEVENPQWELAKIVEIRIQTMKERFFAIKKESDEIKSALVTDQKYLNVLVPKLREEERSKFKDYDISYQPTKVTPQATARAPKMSASDKALMQGAQLMNLTLEQYKKVMADAIKSVMNVECSCQITPGMCKVHPK